MARTAGAPPDPQITAQRSYSASWQAKWHAQAARDMLSVLTLLYSTAVLPAQLVASALHSAMRPRRAGLLTPRPPSGVAGDPDAADGVDGAVAAHSNGIVVGGMALIASAFPEPGVVHHSGDPGRVVFGDRRGAARGRRRGRSCFVCSES